MKNIRVALIIAVVATLLTTSTSLAQDRMQRPSREQNQPVEMKPPEQMNLMNMQQVPVNTSPICKPLTFLTTSPLPETGVGYDYNFQLEVDGGTPPLLFGTPEYGPNGVYKGLGPGYTKKSEIITWYQGWVNGLTITQSGLIQGQPLMAGNYQVKIVVQDSCASGIQTANKNFALNVK